MRTLIAAAAFVSMFAAGAVVSACGSSSSQPTAPTATATTYAAGQPQPCPPPGYPNPPPGCVPYQPGAPTGAPTPYPTGAPTPTTAPTPVPTPTPSTTATGMSTLGTIACTDDGPICGTAHCNKAIGKCANPCQSTQFDCIPGNQCTVMPVVGPVCQPLPGVGQVLP